MAEEQTRRVWITGASSGIGRCLALEMARRGCDLVLTARRTSQLEALAAEIAALGRKAALCPADVRDWEAMCAVPGSAAEQLGDAPIDVAVANAGIIYVGPLGTIETPDEARTIDVNVNGVIHTVQAVLPAMVERDDGLLVAISSLAGLVPLPERAAYAASKSAVISYMRSLKLELAETNVKTTVVLPGYVISEMTEDAKTKLPFLWSGERAARYIADGIDKKKATVSFPWQLHLAIRMAKMLPAPLRDHFLRRQKAPPRD